MVAMTQRKYYRAMAIQLDTATLVGITGRSVIMTDTPKYDVIVCSAPEDIQWCTLCDRYETMTGSRNKYLLEENAPISYDFYLRLSEVYGLKDSKGQYHNPYKKWLNDDKPEV